MTSITSTTTPAAARATLDDAIALLREADRLHARALEVLASTGEDSARGLPTEWLVRLEGRRARWDARELLAAADLLRQMPRAAALVREGVVSFSQLRAIARAVRPVPIAQRARIDDLIARRARVLAASEPEQLIDEVADLVARIRIDLTVAREERAIEGSFLALQPRLDGGGTLYGEADAEAFATIAGALDAAADRPAADRPAAGDEDEEPGTRARQRMDALVRLCAATPEGASARPRVSVIVESSDLEAGARLLAPVATRPVRLSRLAADVVLCDAIIQPFVFRDGEPVGVGDARTTVPDKVRAAVIARDGGCRFPGCSAPAAWSDVHHILPRARGGDARAGNLVLLCRRCHRRVHRGGWRLAWEPDGALGVRAGGRRYTSHPRARPQRE